MHVLISIDDQPGGVPSVKTLTHPVIVAPEGQMPKTPATDLMAFLLQAVAIWNEVQDKTLEEAIAVVQAATGNQTIN
ncbi:hypothetical protein HC024_00335 [Methylococcaceae bacterium WWC4]|nr:hypothetical protein [Methylococcaceae bacterium WWC4]